MLEMPEAMIEGTKLIAKVVGAPRIYYGIEINKRDAIEVIRNKISGEKNMEVVELDVKYPQGSEKQLIKAVMDREVPPGNCRLMSASLCRTWPRRSLFMRR